ncbi:MAG: NADH-quinone oxidoreductase subunit C [Candidatus Saganbacteria bacterium]|nr:NADH-quinone oxidoreductase subunit C [Candidatus Saganbacteria bacterium]
MSDIEKTKENLIQKFPALAEKTQITRETRIWTEIPFELFLPVFNYLLTDLHFNVLCAITGMDEVTQFSVIYHLAKENQLVVSLKVILASKEKPFINTITDTFPAADIYERELVDLLGIHVNGLKEGNRYPLPDNWPQGEYPLRKGWTADRLKKKEGGAPNA